MTIRRLFLLFAVVAGVGGGLIAAFVHGMPAALDLNPVVGGLLLAVGVLGLLVEMQTLHGVAGLLGIAALTTFFGLHALEGQNGVVAVVMALAGVAAILFELHVVPGHGIALGTGVAALTGAVFVAFGWPYVGVALQAMSIAIVLSALGFWAATRIVPENAFMRRLMLGAEQGPHYLANPDFTHVLGASGVAASYLRPAGLATIDGERVDVLTEGEFVPAGTPIRVTRVEGARVFVTPIERLS